MYVCVYVCIVRLSMDALVYGIVLESFQAT